MRSCGLRHITLAQILRVSLQTKSLRPGGRSQPISFTVIHPYRRQGDLKVLQTLKVWRWIKNTSLLMSIYKKAVSWCKQYSKNIQYYINAKGCWVQKKRVGRWISFDSQVYMNIKSRLRSILDLILWLALKIIFGSFVFFLFDFSQVLHY